MAIARAFATAAPAAPLGGVRVAQRGRRRPDGSRYMADHPVVPLDRVAAQLNIDMIGRNRCDDPAEANTVYLVGSDRISTELHNLNEEANASLRKPLALNYEMNDVADLESLYTRSDHYSYAAEGRAGDLLHHRPAPRLPLRDRRSGQDPVRQGRPRGAAGVLDGVAAGQPGPSAGARSAGAADGKGQTGRIQATR